MPTQPLPFVVLVLVLYVLTTARLTRLVTTDKLTEPVRVRITKARQRAQQRRAAQADPDQADPPVPSGTDWIVYQVHCPWCFGFWIALALAWPAAAYAGLPWWWSPGLALACSYAVGWLASREGL